MHPENRQASSPSQAHAWQQLHRAYSTMFTHQNSLAEPSHISCALPCVLNKLTMGSQWQIVLRDNEHVSSIQSSYIHCSSKDCGFNCCVDLTSHKHFQDVSINQKEVFKIVSFSSK